MKDMGVFLITYHFRYRKIADYVTLIDNGEIVLSEEKDNILNRWKLVRGDRGQLKDLKEDLIGLRLSKTYFEALINDINAFNNRYDTSSLVIDNASLDDILLHLAGKEN